MQPFSECVVSMSVLIKKTPFVGIFEPFHSKLSSYGLIGASAVVNCTEKCVPVRLMNVSDSIVNVNSELVVGKLSECKVGNVDKSCNFLTSNESNSTTRNHMKVIIDSLNNNENPSPSHKKEIFNLLDKYSSLFSTEKNDIGFVPDIEHDIIIKENSPCQQIHSKVPLHVEDWVDKQVSDLLNRGIIRESHSSWSAPVVVVKKRNGDFRLCIDYRRLNSVTIKPTFQIPDSRTIFDSLNGSRYYSAIDISSAYYQCAVNEEHKKYTAFTTRKGQFEFNRMPFGLSGAPFTFQRLMNSILREENWQTCLIYLDDVLIFSRTSIS